MAGGPIPLVDCAEEPHSRVGRKAALLGWAHANGMGTPGGLVVPADRFWAALEACGAGQQARYLQRSAFRLDPRHTFDIAASIHASMAAPAVAVLAGAEADSAFAHLVAPRVVCRSSSAMEDGRAAAFPGVFVSVLNVGSPAALADAMVRCWRSVFSADAIRYLLRVGAEPVDFSLALLLQRQVEAAWYGLYVSVDPLTGAAEPLADLTDAEPEALVSGEGVTRRARRRPGGWVGVDGVIAESLETVRRAAERLAAHLQSGVDLEFALPSGGGQPVLLQCRPLTRAVAGDPVGAPGAPAGSAGLVGRACASGHAVGLASEGEGSGIAVLRQLTTADYDIVFRSAGLVTEQDASPLSHVAILCRELGVPFVCGVDGARDLLVGRRVAVNGSSGEIHVLGESAELPVAQLRNETVGPTLSTVELVLRVLAEGRPGYPPEAEAERIGRRLGRALGTGRARLVDHPIAPSEVADLDRIGTSLFGPRFSAASLLGRD